MIGSAVCVLSALTHLAHKKHLYPQHVPVMSSPIDVAKNLRHRLAWLAPSRAVEIGELSLPPEESGHSQRLCRSIAAERNKFNVLSASLRRIVRAGGQTGGDRDQ